MILCVVSKCSQEALLWRNNYTGIARLSPPLMLPTELFTFSHLSRLISPLLLTISDHCQIEELLRPTLVNSKCDAEFWHEPQFCLKKFKQESVDIQRLPYLH